MTRSFFLWASRNKQLQRRLAPYRFIRRAVSRFMPGENLTDALEAAERLAHQRIATVVTFLGENVTDRSQAEQAASEYLKALNEIETRKLNCQLSVKLTQLGFDLDPQICHELMQNILQKAADKGNFVWIDMESSSYTTSTIAFFRRLRNSHPNTGLCLQSYLYRTRDDLESLLSMQPAIRLVKGAYAEPPEIAFPKKRDNDENYFLLAKRLLEASANGNILPAIATHDLNLIHRIQEEAKKAGMSNDRFEIQMLYGIKPAEQLRLAQEGYKVRVLISYGTYWFPWYMRRLAERPANFWFVVKSLFG